VTAVTDPVGDETDGIVQHDITSVSMAEPVSNTQTGAADNIVFTMKVQTSPPSRRDGAGPSASPSPDTARGRAGSWTAGRLVRLDAFIR